MNDVICVYRVVGWEGKEKKERLCIYSHKELGFLWVETPYKHIIVSKIEDLGKLENQR